MIHIVHITYISNIYQMDPLNQSHKMWIVVFSIFLSIGITGSILLGLSTTIIDNFVMLYMGILFVGLSGLGMLSLLVTFMILHCTFCLL